MVFHERARAVAEELSGAGLAAEALAIVEAIEVASTGTEMLMGIRYHLRQVAASDAAIDAETRERIRALLVDLDAALDR